MWTLIVTFQQLEGAQASHYNLHTILTYILTVIMRYLMYYYYYKGNLTVHHHVLCAGQNDIIDMHTSIIYYSLSCLFYPNVFFNVMLIDNITIMKIVVCGINVRDALTMRELQLAYT